MLATVVQTKDLLYSVAASLIAGIGVTAVFSLIIFGVTRSADLLRNDRPLLATAAGGLAAVAMVVVAAAIVLGVVVMASK